MAKLPRTATQFLFSLPKKPAEQSLLSTPKVITLLVVAKNQE